jgi:folate-binding protein YgfZ
MTKENSARNARVWDGGITGWVRVYGEDAFQYLQSQCSQDVRGAIDGGAAYGLFLTLKGKVRADCFVIGLGEDGFAVVSYHTCVGKMVALLEENVIADDVEFEEVSGAGSLVVEGECDASLYPGALVFPGRRMEATHYDVVLPMGSGIPEGICSAEELEFLRIKDGIVAVPRDIGSGELPQEGGLEDVAVSFYKGCFLGQEVMARIKAMGQVQRKIHKVTGIGSVPDFDSPLIIADKCAGTLKSVCTAGEGAWCGLALLHKKFGMNPGDAGWRLPDGRPVEVALHG